MATLPQTNSTFNLKGWVKRCLTIFKPERNLAEPDAVLEPRIPQTAFTFDASAWTSKHLPVFDAEKPQLDKNRTKQADQYQSFFFKLPSELRNMVYAYLTVGDVHIYTFDHISAHWMTDGEFQPFGLLGFLLSCRRV